MSLTNTHEKAKQRQRAKRRVRDIRKQKDEAIAGLAYEPSAQDIHRVQRPYRVKAYKYLQRVGFPRERMAEMVKAEFDESHDVVSGGAA